MIHKPIPMHERSDTNGGGEYRYGFNGMEGIDEMVGNENGYDFGARMYDGRLGRWWSVDPVGGIQPQWSDYKGFMDNPIIYIDPEGNTEYLTIIIKDQNGHSMSMKVIVFENAMTALDKGVKGSLSKPMRGDELNGADFINHIFSIIEEGRSLVRPNVNSNLATESNVQKKDSINVTFTKVRVIENQVYHSFGSKMVAVTDTSGQIINGDKTEIITKVNK